MDFFLIICTFNSYWKDVKIFITQSLKTVVYNLKHYHTKPKTVI